MKTAHVIGLCGRISQIDINVVQDISCLVGCHADKDIYVLCNGKRLEKSEIIKENHVYRIQSRLPGGKGGFGSMLRAIGAQIEKTTNHEACRDLSGRRMRDLNNEKKLREWVAKQADREREKEERRQAKLERRRSGPRHTFSDPAYSEAMSSMSETTRDAVKAGLEKASEKSAKPSTCRKRKACETADFDVKKACADLGIDVNLDDMELSDSDLSDTNSASDKDDSKQQPSAEVQNSPTHSDDQVAKETTISVQSSNSSRDITTNDNGCLNIKDATPQSETASSLVTQSDKSEDTVARFSETNTKQEPEPKEIEEICVEEVKSVQELEQCGLDALKSALEKRGVKCGGTLEERAERLWSIRGLKQEEIPHHLIPKPSKKNKKK